MSEVEASDPLRSKGGDTGNGGESLVVPCFWNGEQITQTLDAVLSKGQTMPEKNRFPAVLVNAIGFNGDQSAQTRSMGEREEQAPTLRADGPAHVACTFMAQDYKEGTYIEVTEAGPLTTSADRSRSAPIVATEGATMFEPRCVRTTGGQPQHELSHCLRADTNSGDGAPCVAFAQNTRDEVREMAIVGALAAEPGMKQTSYIRQAMAVRRLTPTECARLQGFPDHHARIPWRGKLPRNAPDGPQYKCYGNSMAVPVIHWLGKQIFKSLKP